MADYSRDQLMQALRSADAAGDTAAAQAIARRLDAMKKGPDFSNVSAKTTTTETGKTDTGIGRLISGRKEGGIGRGLKLGLRNTLEGVAGIPDAFGGNALGKLVEMATGQPQASYTDLARNLSDKLGLPTADTAEERVMSDIGRGISGTAVTMGAGGLASQAPGVVGRVGQFFSAGPGMQTLSTVTGTGAAGLTRERGGSEGQQIAAGLIGGLAPGAIPAAAAGSVRTLARGGEAGRQQMTQGIQQFERAGTSPTLGQVSPNARAQYAEAGLRNAPGAASVVRRRLEGQSEELGQQVENLAGRLSPAQGAERGGKAIEAGITGPSGFMQRFKQESAKLYAQVDQQIPKGTPVNASATQQTLANLTTPIPGAKQTSQTLMNGKVNAIAQAFSEDLAAGQGRISYDAMKQLRSQIGEMIGDTTLTVDTPTRQLRQLYGAMSEDLTQAAMATKNPQAISAAKRASNYYKAGMGRVEEVERVIDRSGGPEAVYRAMFSNSREGGTTLRKVMQSLDGKSQRDLAAVTLRRLGRANPSAQDDLGEVFSPTTFLTNWNKMAPEAKRALFDRFGTGFRDDLDTIAATTSKMRDAAQILPNPSGTAPAAAQATAYGTIATSLAMMEPTVAAGVAGAMGTANLGARAFTSPKVVKWLAQQTKLPAGSLPAQLAILAQIAKTDDAAAELHAQLTQQGGN